MPLSDLIKEAFDKYGVSLPQTYANPVAGSNVTGPRASYFLRDDARAGYGVPSVANNERGANVLGSINPTDPSRVNIDSRSHRMLNIPPEYTRVHEGSHQDMLYSGRMGLLPFSAFMQRPIGNSGGLSFNDFVSDNSTTTANEYDFQLRQAAGKVSKKYNMGNNLKEFLADMKAYEASQPRGTDIEQTKLWGELLDNMGNLGKTQDGQKALKQWYLYNNTATPPGMLQQLLGIQ